MNFVGGWELMETPFSSERLGEVMLGIRSARMEWGAAPSAAGWCVA